MVESLKFCLQLLMLLGNLIYNESDVMQHCPLQNTVPNFTAEAGSPFYFSILHNATKKHLRQLQMARGKDLPPWVEYRHHKGHLVGLALPEDCGIHHLQLSVTAHNCTADFFVLIHIPTIRGNSPERDTFPCPDREISVWGNLLLHINPVHLNASRRIHMVSTIADDHHLQWNSISLFSSTNFNVPVPYHDMLRACGPSDLQEKDFKRDGTLGNVTQILWHFGCKSQEQLCFLQHKYNNALETGIFIKKLDVQVLAWRLLCTVEVAHKVKRDLRSEVSTFPSQLTSTGMTEWGNNRASEGQKLAQTNYITLNHFLQSSDKDTFSSDHTESDMRMSLLSFEQNITPVLSTQRHVTTNFEWLPTSLTPGAEQDGRDIWTEMYGYSHSESPHPVLLKSLDHHDFTQDFSSPSVSDKHQKETYEVSLSFSIDQSPQSSNATLVTQMFFPTSHLTQPSNSEQTGPKISPMVSGAGQEAIYLLNATITDLPLATLVSQTSLHLLESSMHVSFTETGTTAYTPPLPFTYSTSELPGTYDKSPLFTVQEFSNSQVFSSGFCSDQFEHAHCSGFLETSEPTTDELPFLTSSQAIQSISLISEQIQLLSDNYINSELIQGSFSQLFAVSNHASYVSSPSSSVHANLKTTTTSTASTSPSVTYPGQVSTFNISATVSILSETITPPTAQQTFTSSPSNSLEMTHIQETLYSSMFLISQLLDATQNVLQTHEITQNATISDVSPETMGREMTQNNLESLLYYSYSPEPTESMYTVPFLYEYSTIGVSWTFGNINPTLTIQDTSILQEFSSITPDSEPVMKTRVESDRAYSSHICSDQSGQSYCFGVLLTTELSNTNLPSFQSTFEGLQLQTTGELMEMSQQKNFVKPPFTTMHFTESQNEVTADTHLSNTLSTALLPSVITSIDFSASESITATSYSEEMTPSTVQEPYTASTIHLFESLEPSFPLCSVDFSRCTSTAVSISLGNTNEYWMSHLVDPVYWTSEVEMSGQTYSATEEYSSFNPKSYADFTSLASSSAQLSQNYVSDYHQMSSDTSAPTYMTSLPVMTFLPLGSSALTEHWETKRVSLLSSQSSTQASVGPSKQSTYFSLYSAVSTTLLLSVGHSSSHIIKLSTSSVAATSTVNFPPQVLQTIPALTATVGFPFSYSIPVKAFVDPEDGAADALSLEMRLIDPPPPSVGSWLSLNGLELHGVPLEMDAHFAPQHALLLSRDKGGLVTSMKFSIDLYRYPVQPCHVFTISASLSLHSVLIQRHKIALFLTKIAAYFNSTIANHLSIVSISSGSTVMSWYNYSLCDNGQCLYKKVNRMWLAMRFKNKTINPKFRDIMLPEFPLINVEPVVFSQDCFPLTTVPATTVKTTSDQQSTSNFSTSTSIAATTARVASYGKMASMFIALLVICSLILIVLFVAAIVYFCQRKPRVVAIFPASRMLSVGSIDLRALRPRRALLLHPEIPPPPLRLWMSLNEDDDRLPPESQEIDPQELPSKDTFSTI